MASQLDRAEGFKLEQDGLDRWREGTMSRLNYLEEEDEALVSLHEDLAVLERCRAAGRPLGPEQLEQIHDLLARLVLLAETFDWNDDKEPLPDWLQPTAPETMAVSRRATGR